MTTTMRILVVDDSPVDRFVAKHVLGRTYPEAYIAEAQDGVEALELLEAEATFDLILLDLNMPRMGGLEFLQVWSERTTATPPFIIVLTSSSQASDQDQAGSFAAVDGFLVKPFKKASATALSKYAPTLAEPVHAEA